MKKSDFRKAVFIDLAVVTALAVATALLTPALVDPAFPLPASDEKGQRAWLNAALFDQTMRSAVERYGSIQGQNSFVDGGIPVGAYPTDGTLSPLSLALIHLNAVQAVRAKTYLAVLFGAASLFLLARRAGAGRPAALAAALLIPASGYVQQRIAYSPLQLQVLFASLGLVAVSYGRCTLTFCLTAALLFALGAMQSGSLIFFAPVAFALAALVRGYGEGEGRKDALGALGLILMFGLLFSTIKWLPAVELLWQHSLRSAAQEFLARNPVGLADRMESFIGLITPGPAWLAGPFFLLAATGSWAEGRRGRLSLMGLIFTFLAILPAAVPDTDGKTSAWMAVRPLSQPQSVAPIFALIVLGALCALAFEKALRFKKPVGYALMTLFVAALFFSHFTKEKISGGELPAPVDMSKHQSPEEGKPQYYSVQLYNSRKAKTPISHHPTLFAMQQIGVTNALDLYDVKTRVSPKVKIRSQGDRTWRNRRYKGEAQVMHKRGEILEYNDFGNRIYVKVRTFKQKADLILNRNYDAGWSAKNYEVSSLKGLAGVHFPEPGEYEVTLQYRPLKALYGAAVSGAALLFALIFLVVEWIVERRKNFPVDI